MPHNAHIIRLRLGFNSQVKSVSRVPLAGSAKGHKTLLTGFHRHQAGPKTLSYAQYLLLYFLQVICYIVHWGHSSQLSSHLHFGQTRDCGDMRSAKDQQEPPLPSPGIEEQQKGHQTKHGPSVSR